MGTRENAKLYVDLTSVTASYRDKLDSSTILGIVLKIDLLYAVYSIYDTCPMPDAFSKHMEGYDLFKDMCKVLDESLPSFYATDRSTVLHFVIRDLEHETWAIMSGHVHTERRDRILDAVVKENEKQKIREGND